MAKKLFLLIFVFPFLGFSQGFEVVPKQLTLETGYTAIRKTNIPDLGTHGMAFALDYGWQVSGFKQKPKAFISIPLGYIAVPPSNDSQKNLGIAYYGVHITHELAANKKNTPFVGYSLLFNQLRKQDIEGRVIGHETRFDAGYLWGKRFFTKLEYSIGSFPALGKKEGDKLGTWGFKLGIRIK